jgi:hypothetical protein
MNSKLSTGAKYKCFVCSQDVSSEGRAYNDIGWSKFAAFSNLSIYSCQICGVGFAMPEFSQEAIYLFYKDQYRAKSSAFYINFNKLRKPGVSDIRVSRAFSQLSLGRSFCEFNSGDLFLDIGPGKGGSFSVANALFSKPSLHAIEFSRDANDYYMKNFKAESHSSLEDFAKCGNKAKIVLMSHSLEHFRIPDLPELFIELRQAMSSDAVIVVEVPNVDMRIHCYNRGPDTPHLLFFSKQSLRQLFEKNGFSVLFADTYGPMYSEHQKDGVASASSDLKDLFRMAFNKLPIFLQVGLRGIVRSSRRLKSYTLRQFISADRNQTELPYQSFGGNRTALRLVAKIRS